MDVDWWLHSCFVTGGVISTFELPRVLVGEVKRLLTSICAVHHAAIGRRWMTSSPIEPRQIRGPPARASHEKSRRQARMEPHTITHARPALHNNLGSCIQDACRLYSQRQEFGRDHKPGTVTLVDCLPYASCVEHHICISTGVCSLSVPKTWPRSTRGIAIMPCKHRQHYY